MPNYIGVRKGLVRGKVLAVGVQNELVADGRDGAVIPHMSFANLVASTAVANTITETLFDQNYSIPANFLRPGSVIRVRFQGIATLTNATDTLAINLRIGGLAGTVLLALAARDVANNDIFCGYAELVVRTIGATGTFVAYAEGPTNPNAAGTAMNQNFLASTTLNTTIAQVVGVTAVWSVANAGDSCRLDVLTVEIA